MRKHLAERVCLHYLGSEAVSWGNEGGERCHGTLGVPAKLPICPPGDKSHGGVLGAAPKSSFHGSGSLVRMEEETKGNKMSVGTAVWPGSCLPANLRSHALCDSIFPPGHQFYVPLFLWSPLKAGTSETNGLDRCEYAASRI